MSDPLEVIWSCIDTPLPRFTADEVSNWAVGIKDRLIAAGILTLTESSDHVACPNCPDRHVEEIVARPGDNGQVRYFIRCPESLRVEMNADCFATWTINFGALARSIASDLALEGHVNSVAAGRVWRLGRTNWNGTLRAVMFARGLLWPDGKEILGCLPRRSIVFVAVQNPPAEFWPGLPPATVALKEVTSLGVDGLQLDRATVAILVEQTDALNRSVSPVALTRQDQNKLFRKEAAIVLKSHLEDSEIETAYLHAGSYRAAAKALSQTGKREVTKDEVSRAIHRLGGPEAVKSRQDSCSVRRTVASQSRDRKKKFSAPP